MQALGGADNAVVNDMTGTDLKLVAFDLEGRDRRRGGRRRGRLGHGQRDGRPPTTSTSRPTGASSTSTGLRRKSQIDHSEAANDKLTVNGLAGADTITGGPGLAALIQLVINGGTEVDVLTGGDGHDRIVGQQQNDSMFGGGRQRHARLEPRRRQRPRRGPGGQRHDGVQRRGRRGDLRASPPTARGCRFTRNVGNIVMDVDGTEQVDLKALGGADTDRRQRPDRHRRDQGGHRPGRRDRRRPPATVLPTRSRSTAPTAPTTSRWPRTAASST